MSRIGKQPVIIPQNVEVSLDGQLISFKGEKGSLELITHPKIRVISQINGDRKVLIVERKNNDKLSRSLHGLTKKLLDNMVIGVSSGFDKKLEIIGVGYRVSLSGDKLIFNIGYSHPIEVTPPQGINFKVEKNIITVSGHDKQLVGQIAANIRLIRKPEPYKGKGIRYVGEKVKIKPGKAAKTASS